MTKFIKKEIRDKLVYIEKDCCYLCSNSSVISKGRIRCSYNNHERDICRLSPSRCDMSCIRCDDFGSDVVVII